MNIKNISIVYLTKNGENTIGKSIKMVLSQEIDIELEIIAIDSGSTDKTLDILSQYPVKMHKILPSEFNYGGTKNYAVNLASGEIVAYLSQDAIPANRHWLKNLILEFKNEKVVGVFSRILPLSSADPLARRKVEEDISNSSEKIIKFIRDDAHFGQLPPYQKRIFCHFNNISSAIRKDILKKFPFPETFFGEDVFWAKGILEKGYKIVYQPKSIVYHTHPTSVIGGFKRNFYDARINKVGFNYAEVNSPISLIKSIWKEIKNDMVYLRRYFREDKLKFAILSPFVRISEMFGAYIGGKW